MNEYKGYLAEIHMSRILLNGQENSFPGKLFNSEEDVQTPDFSYVHHRVRLGSGANREIDVLGTAGIEKWVCQSKWIAALKTGALDIIKEVSLHGDFLHDICEILGYRSVIQGEGKKWTLHAEAYITDGGGSADAALGFFSAAESKRGAMNFSGRIVAPIELKGATNDLDRAASGRKESAIEQGWRYANYTEGCRWIIVSNYREIRLQYGRLRRGARPYL